MLINIKKVLFIFAVIFSKASFGQQTIGLQLNSEDSYDGYTLFAPIGSTTTYLINNCGEEVHSWPSDYKPRFSCYLLENGVLLRLGRVPGPAGGSAIAEMIDWSGAVIWSYEVPVSVGIQHHDLELLPNGNILFIVTDVISQTQITQAGCTNSASTLNSEKIVEVAPDIVNGGGTIVWEWSAWDHLIQDVDSTKDNYGVIADHPERINVNFQNQPGGNWLHMNAIDYNPGFDQIIVSNRNLSEFWVIDHSTTTAESSDSVGGLYGKGGDLLYRWGNPQSYNRGDSSDQKLFGQHHTHWVTNSPNDDGKVILFNNGAGIAVGQSYSNVNMVELPVSSSGFYSVSTSAYGPVNFDYTYQATPATSFYSALVSGAEVLPNGNILVCEGVPGHFFELDQNDNIVWEYINPVNDFGPQIQGDMIINNNVFRCTRYSPDYAGLQGKDLTPSGTIEQGVSEPCQLYALNIEENNAPEIVLFPNPAHLSFSIIGLSYGHHYLITLVSSTGQEVLATTEFNNIDLTGLSGIYYVVIEDGTSKTVKKISIQ